MVGSIFCVTVAIISLKFCFDGIRDIVCDNLGELRYELVFSKGTLVIIKNAKLISIAPNTQKLINELENELEQEVAYLDEKIEAYQKKWWWILKFKKTSCFDEMIKEQEEKNKWYLKKQKIEQ